MSMKSFLKSFVDRLRNEPRMKKLLADGLEIGSNFSYGRNCFFDPAHCFLISIGDNAFEFAFAVIVMILLNKSIIEAMWKVMISKLRKKIS